MTRTSASLCSIALGLTLLLAANGCSDPESRFAAAFDRGLSRHKAAVAKGFTPTERPASSGVASMGQTYAHYYAVPVDLQPLMEGSERGVAMLRQAQRHHDDPAGRALAARCLRIIQSERKVRFRASGPFKSPWLAYHYD